MNRNSLIDLLICGLVLSTLLGAIYWHRQGDPVLELAPPSQVYITPVKAGEIATVDMPVLPLRDCEFIGPKSYRVFHTHLGVLREPTPSRQIDFGELGQWNMGFRFTFPVPPGMPQGRALVRWETLYDCGLRNVKAITAWYPIEVLPE